MNTRDLMEARLKEQRGEIRVVPTPVKGSAPPADEDDLRETETEAEETLDALTEKVIKRLLRKATDEKNKVAIAKVAVAYLAVKNRATPIFGEGLDDDQELA